MLKLIHLCIALIIILSLCLLGLLMESRIIFKGGIDWLEVMIIVSIILYVWVLVWMRLRRVGEIYCKHHYE